MNTDELRATMEWICGECDASFTRKDNLTRHRRGKHRDIRHQCMDCGTCFNRLDNYQRHQQRCVANTFRDRSPIRRYDNDEKKETFTVEAPITLDVAPVYDRNKVRFEPIDDSAKDGSPFWKENQVGYGIDIDGNVIGEDPTTSDIFPASVKHDEYEIKRIGERTFAKSKAIETNFKVKVNEKWVEQRIENVQLVLTTIFNGVIDTIRSKSGPNDKGKVVIKHPDLENPIIVPPMPIADLNADVVLSRIEQVLTSNQDLSIREEMEIIVGKIHMPEGAGFKTVTNLVRDLKDKRSVVIIRNDDEMCAARAIGVGYAKLRQTIKEEFDVATEYLPQGTTHAIKLLTTGKCLPSYYRNVRRTDTSKHPNQKKLAEALCEKAGVPTDRPCGINELVRFERVLDVNIGVIQMEAGNQFVKKPTDETKDTIYLYLHDDHFDMISSMTGFFNTSYFCESCLQPYTHKDRHRCSTHCTICTSADCIADGKPIQCDSCHQLCRNIACLVRHKDVIYQNSSNRCDAFYRCKRCNKTMSNERKDGHRCGEWKCSCCEEWVLEDHLCYQRCIDAKIKEPRFVFYDFETTQEQKMECQEGYVSCNPERCENCSEELCNDCRRCKNCQDSKCGLIRHVVNLAVAQTVCPFCVESELPTCIHCGQRCAECKDKPCQECPLNREVIFKGPDAATMFFQWLIRPQYKHFTVIAHNAKGFDGYFVLDYLAQQGIRPDNVIFNGTKLNYLRIQQRLNMRFIDSLNFMPMKLAALPKSFDLKEIKKGYFPHTFNRAENWSYKGPYPDKSYYRPDQMSEDDRTTFLEWYNNRKCDTFDFQRELTDYCRSDVDILKRACLEFRKLMMDSTNVDPFQCITIASVAMTVFKTKFLYENWKVTLEDGSVHDALYQDGQFKIENRNAQDIVHKTFVSSPLAQVPANGYVSRVQHSKSSIQWLEWIQHTQDINIQHALNGRGEYKIGPYHVDGICHENKTVYEFNGCFWHGCETCYTHDRTEIKNKRTNQTMNELLALTQHKKTYLNKCGYKVISKWEHEFRNELLSNKSLGNFVDSLDIQERLNPRDSFFGGRTNAIKMYHLVEDEEEIRYVDFTSLYPYVNKYMEYPLGHPVIITNNFEPLNQYFGLAKIKILPPRGLYLPVLPYKSNGKLKFPLCRTCADNETQGSCKCQDEQRALTGTWCIPEIIEAVVQGYTIIKIYEIYHFKQTARYDTDTEEGGLFATYVNTFLKFKQESSDWPDHCVTEDERKQYIHEYFEHEGVRLDWDKIEQNPGLRYLAKLLLNSFWGKFGQRTNFKQTKYFSDKDLADFYALLSDPTKDIHNFHVVNDRLILLEFTDKDNSIPEENMTNIFIATFTTCWARLRLYDIMKRLGDRVLYHDTDSVIYIHRPGYPGNPVLGNYLGELTNELGAGDHILEYVSAGPKNYAYRTTSGKQCCKVRGFNLNYENQQLVNFDVMKEIVTNGGTGTVNTRCDKIARDKSSNTLFNKQQRKTYRLVYDKRVRDTETMMTFPFGY